MVRPIGGTAWASGRGGKPLRPSTLTSFKGLSSSTLRRNTLLQVAESWEADENRKTPGALDRPRYILPIVVVVISRSPAWPSKDGLRAEGAEGETSREGLFADAAELQSQPSGQKSETEDTKLSAGCTRETKQNEPKSNQPTSQAPTRGGNSRNTSGCGCSSERS